MELWGKRAKYLPAGGLRERYPVVVQLRNGARILSSSGDQRRVWGSVSSWQTRWWCGFQGVVSEKCVGRQLGVFLGLVRRELVGR